MAAVAEIPTDDVRGISSNTGGDKIVGDGGCVGDEKSSSVECRTESELQPESQLDGMQKLVSMIKQLNPLAKEFFPSHYNQKNNQEGEFNQLLSADDFVSPKKPSDDEFYSGDKKDGNIRRRRNNYGQGGGRRRFTGRANKAQREDSVRRTIYVSDIDQSVSEELLAELFSSCGQVVDCRICGDPHSVLRFAFVEFAYEQGARLALSLGGTMLGYYPVRVLPSKTAILPVNPTFLPRSEDEREMCTRTVYCTNIDKKVSQADVTTFFESTCGEVTHLRLLGDQMHSTRIAFVEFATAESAVKALSCSGMVLGTQPIRVSPSKTPVRPRISRSSSTE
ncbi:PREDICTED: polyadenylate-binding protein-interacting protein 9-like [Tarenaya hassleriana]|uniref:polyadenylate-binding protein-interacting protein 9-like n=1 Tax=Tarenaya hassleriana TaxID=28532 RepID=UPI00053C9B75|nr:PREDICTED: polyadenylate-binding protein-interacting protein 9-like [Tarenaya hassleriana]XP_010552173.1 PREDICTED: polyadenylate-binding protein-interacting protein 9-like [Tarenaya hassleriana]XP_010552174.1 PREDICTED: polyadenylate-binding protein-interacting protein 9-like [Tarenaya hassleriana]